MRKIFVLTLLAVFGAAMARAESGQHATLSGFVYDASNGEGLIGANVYLEGTQIGGSTNLSGYYVIPHIPVGRYTLVVHYIGFKAHKEEVVLAVDDKKTITVNLEPSTIELGKVVVTEEAIPAADKLFEKPVSELKLSARQIREVPQVAEADLLRALQTLPGIVPISDFSSALYIRGGTPDQNLVLLDGTDVYNPEHAFGLFSTFNTDAIKQVELSKGGFGAQYGGRLSSILNVTNLDGNREEFEMKGSISLLSAKTTVQMPIGSIGSISGSIRRTYFDKTIAKAIDDVPDYYFYDGNIKAFFDIDEKNKLTISGYGGKDLLDLIFDQDATDQAGLVYDWGNKTGSIRWTRIFSPQLFANFWVTSSRFDSDFEFKEAIDVTELNRVTDLSFKGDLQYHLTKSFNLGFGFEQKNLHLIFRQGAPDGKINVDSKPRHYAAYLLGNWRPNYRWEIETGMRYNYFGSDENFQNLAPRFSAKYRVTDAITIKAAGGLHYQYLHRIPRAFIADIWVASNRFQKESKATHAILGFNKDFSDDYQLELEAYYKDYDNIHSFNQNVAVDISPQEYQNGIPVYTATKGVFNSGNGNSKGIELLLRKDRGVITGWLGYGLAKTKYIIENVNQGRSFSPRHDRTHYVNLVANIDWRNLRRVWRGKEPTQLGSNWRIGITFIYTSGQPITLPGSGYYVNTLPDWGSTSYELYPSEINTLRLPPYARLDLSLTYERHFKSWSIFPYLQIFNTGNRKNVWFIDYNSNVLPNDEIRLDVDTTNMFPLLPTIGVNFEF